MKDYIWVVEIRLADGSWLPLSYDGHGDRGSARWAAGQRRREFGQNVRIRKYVRVEKTMRVVELPVVDMEASE